MDANERRYLKEIGSSMAAFTAMVAVSIWLLKGHEHSPLRCLVALLPVIPSAFAPGRHPLFSRARRVAAPHPVRSHGLQLPGHVPDLAQLGSPAKGRSASR